MALIEVKIQISLIKVVALHNSNNGPAVDHENKLWKALHFDVGTTNTRTKGKGL